MLSNDKYISASNFTLRFLSFLKTIKNGAICIVFLIFLTLKLYTYIMKKTFTLSCLILASIIGAGFASGKEIEIFFTRYGVASYVGIAIVFLLFNLLISSYLQFGNEFKPNTFFGANKMLMGKFSNVFNMFILISCFIVLAGMFAGVYEVYLCLFSKITSTIFTVLTAILVIIELVGGVKSIKQVNNIFIPITMIILIISAFIVIEKSNTYNVVILQNSLVKVVLSAFSYVGINILLSGSILITEGKFYSNKQIKSSAIISSLILCLIILLFNFVMQSNNVVSSLPMLSLSFNISYVWGIIVLVCIWFSIFSTISSVTFVISTSICKTAENFSVYAVGVVVVGYVISLFGFSEIIEFLYPIIGVMGVGYSVIIVYKVTTNKLLCKNKKSG